MGYADGNKTHKIHLLGSGDAIMSNRISYVLDLKGSSNTLDTGCVSFIHFAKGVSALFSTSILLTKSHTVWKSSGIAPGLQYAEGW
jgi:hypothetical protein